MRPKDSIKVKLFAHALLALTGLSPIVALAQISGLPFIRNYSNVEYKAGIQNWDIAQDSRGLLYVANNFGLLEYDGSEWKTYSVKNGPKVRSVAVDGRGRIYVGCQSEFGYFFPDHRGQLQYVSLADSLAPQERNFDEAWSVYLDGNRVFFCTFTNIYVFDGETLQTLSPPNGIDHSYYTNRQLFVNQPSIGLASLQGLTFQLLPGGSFFRDMSISAVLGFDQSAHLVSTFQDGIFLLEGGQARPWAAALQEEFRTSIVNCGIRLRNGNFAFGTQNNGLLIFTPAGKLLRHITRSRGIENRTILSLYEDDLNNLWVGQNNGLSYIELGSPFTFLNEEIGLPGSGYSAYLDGNTLYLGTNTGVYIYNAEEKTFSLLKGSNGQVYHIGRYGDALLVGHHNGALRWSGDRFEPLSAAQGSWTFLSPRHHTDKLVEGTYAGLQLYSRNGPTWKFETSVPGFEESSRVMADDPLGNFWVTHGYKGAYRLRFNADMTAVEDVKHYGAEQGFPSHLLINVFRARNELLFTSEQGIYQYDSIHDRFVRDPFFAQKLGENAQVWFIQEDALGNIYFLSREKIGVLRRNALGDYVLESEAFNKIRKYLNDDLNNISILKNNDVLFGAKDGFIHYSPAQQSSKRQTFHTLIRQVSVNSGDSVLFFGNYVNGNSIRTLQSDDQRPRLPFRLNSLDFTYAATAFEGNDDLVYQFRLDNFENGWSEWTSQKHKEYTNLREGDYTFQVRARNINGTVSDIASYRFTIYPPWYRSVVAYAIYGVAIAASLFAGFIVIDRKYQREQKLLEQKQRDELSQKETELEQLSQQSQEEIARLQHEKLESELRHMNSELATSTMHLLNKNEFIAAVRSNISVLAKKNLAEDVRKELLKIAHEIEQNISHDKDWEHFQWHFDRVHGDFSQRFKAAFPSLTPQDIKLSAYLRMNLSTKEIAQLLNISPRGVEISRYRLRKKLQLEKNQNLQEFVLDF